MARPKGPPRLSAEGPSRTFPKEARVRRRSDYLRVQKQAVRVAAPHFVFLITATPADTAVATPRLGIIASKQLGNAIVRARGKRLIRSAFREVSSRFPVGLDIVVLARGDIRALGLSDVLNEWRVAKAGILRRAKALLSPAPSPSGAAEVSLPSVKSEPLSPRVER